MSNNIYSAIIAHDNELLEQVSSLLSRNDAVEGRAAIADCMAVILQGRRTAIENDFNKDLHDGFRAANHLKDKDGNVRHCDGCGNPINKNDVVYAGQKEFCSKKCAT